MKFQIKITFFFLFLPLLFHAQGKITSGLPWSPLNKIDNLLIPASDGSLWLASANIQYEPEQSAIYLARLDENGNQLFQKTIKRGKELGKYNIIGLVHSASAVKIVVSQEDKEQKMMHVFQSTLDDKGALSELVKIWSFKPDHKIQWEDQNCLVKQSDDDSKILISSYDGEHYAVFDQDNNLQWEGAYENSNPLSLVDGTGVSNTGDVGFLFFENQNGAFVTVKQGITIKCCYADKSTRIEKATPVDGFVSSTSLKLGFRSNGSLVLAGFSFRSDNSYEATHVVVTEIVKGQKEAMRKVFEIGKGQGASLNRVQLIAMNTGHLVLMPNEKSETVYEIPQDHNISAVNLFKYNYDGYAIGFECVIATSKVIYGLKICDDECVSKKGIGKGKVGRQKEYGFIITQYIPGQEIKQTLAAVKFPEKHFFNYEFTGTIPAEWGDRYAILGILGTKGTILSFDPEQ
jgi:hypothetical protein